VSDPHAYDLHLGYPSYENLYIFEISFLDICYITAEVPDEILVYNSEDLSFEFNVNFSLNSNTADGQNCEFLRFEVFSDLADFISVSSFKMEVAGATLPPGDYPVTIEAVVA
jgi:hypothetical protein